MLTDREISESRHDEDLAIVSADLKSRGVHVFSIGVGMNISTLELEGIASKSENVFTAPTFNDLLVISNHLRAEICQGEHYVGRRLYLYLSIASPESTCSQLFYEKCISAV